MNAVLRAAAEAAPGFMPPDEGMALYAAAYRAAVLGPLVEIGTYCGKSTIYLGPAHDAADAAYGRSGGPR